MNKKLLEQLEKQLKDNKMSLEGSLQKFAKKDTMPEGDWDTIYPKSNVNSLEEMADEVEEFSSLIKVEYALEVKLKNITDALKKMTDGRYGFCEKCSQQIEEDKLAVVPETKTCKSCQ